MIEKMDMKLRTVIKSRLLKYFEYDQLSTKHFMWIFVAHCFLPKNKQVIFFFIEILVHITLSCIKCFISGQQSHVFVLKSFSISLYKVFLLSFLSLHYECYHIYILCHGQIKKKGYKRYQTTKWTWNKKKSISK